MYKFSEQGMSGYVWGQMMTSHIPLLLVFKHTNTEICMAAVVLSVTWSPFSPFNPETLAKFNICKTHRHNVSIWCYWCVPTEERESKDKRSLNLLSDRMIITLCFMFTGAVCVCVKLCAIDSKWSVVHIVTRWWHCYTDASWDETPKLCYSMQLKKGWEGG